MFLDSSALVKRYADEPGAAVVRSLVEAVAVSILARVEVPAALWRKHRIGELSLEDAAVLVEEFEWEWFGDAGASTDGRFAIVSLAPDVLELAARLTGVHGLRAYDSVQLASAIAARTADAGLDRFVCFDGTLATAARVEGFRVAP